MPSRPLAAAGRPRLLHYVLPLSMTHVAYTGVRVALTLYAVRLGASGLQLGLVVGLLSALPMLLSMSAGRMTDVFGHRAPAAISAATVATGCGLVFVLPHLATLFAASVLVGCGFMGIHVSTNNAVGRATPPQGRTHAYSVIAIGFSIASVLGPSLAGFAIDALGEPGTFLLLGGIAAAASLATLAVHAPGQLPREASAQHRGKLTRDLLRHRPLRRVLILSGLCSMAWDLFIFLVPIHCAKNGLSASVIGIVMATFALATLCTRLVLPRVAAAVGEWKTICACLAFVAAAYLLLPMGTSAAWLVFVAALLGAGLGATQPLVMSLLFQAAPDDRGGEAVGIRTTIMSASQTFLPIIFGVLSGAVSGGGVFALFSLVLAGGVLRLAIRPASG